MIRRLALCIGHRHAGTVSQLKNGRLTFEYSEAYLADPLATPLSVSMPLKVGTHTDRRITPWLWGLLPDNDAVINRWAREFQVSSGSAFSLLSTPVGEDCPGAVRLVAPDRLAEVLTAGQQQTESERLTESDIAVRLRDLRNDQTSWLGSRHSGRFSLADAQPKTALFRDPHGGWSDPRGATATTHILKPAIGGLPDHDLNEHLCLNAMRKLGLRAVKSSFVRFDDESAIVVTRYDRLWVEGAQTRVHQEDLCQALGVHPVRKYQNEGGPSPRDIATLFRRVMPISEASDATLGLLDALIFNWVIAGTDAHAKNYALLLHRSEVRLAPFYDVASALPYDLPLQKQRLAMKFGNTYRLGLVSSPWARLAEELGLPEEGVRLHAKRLIEEAPAAFSAAAGEVRDHAPGSSLPTRLTDLVARRAQECAALLR